jgi:hypothetical protein
MKEPKDGEEAWRAVEEANRLYATNPEYQKDLYDLITAIAAQQGADCEGGYGLNGEDGQSNEQSNGQAKPDGKEAFKESPRLVPDYTDAGEMDPNATSEVLALDQMNARYYVVMDGAKTRVMFFDKISYPLQHKDKTKKERILTREVPTFLGFDDFRNYEYHPKMRLPPDIGRKARMVGIGEWWLENPKRNQYAALSMSQTNPRLSAINSTFGAAGAS